MQPKEGSSVKNSAQASSDENQSAAAEGANARRYKAPVVDRSRVVSRPVSKVQVKDPREFQIGQIRRRFAPTEESGNEGTVFHIKMAPSDPDFPYEIEHVLCSLTVPSSYPEGRPSIRVTNKELKRGFQLNIERGFHEIVISNSDATLLGLFNRLDKELETLLSKEMAETVKFIRPERQVPELPIAPPAIVPRQETLIIPQEVRPVFTSEQKNQAQKKRQVEVRQITARLGRLNGFVQHTDGVTFTLPFQPLKKDTLLVSLQKQSNFRLIVPEMYNLHPARIELHGNTGAEAKQLEDSFRERAKTNPDLTLLAHVNYLSQHAHTMSIPKAPAETASSAPLPVVDTPQTNEATDTATPSSPQGGVALPGKGHVHFIPRPPEWGHAAEEDDDDGWSSDESLSTDQEEGSEEDSLEEHTDAHAPSMAAERGILLSFPGLELHSIELLELVSLNITVKCDRCKDTTDISRLRNNTAGDHTGMKEERCKKCANSLAAGELIPRQVLHAQG